jgi:tricorn protease
MRPFPPGLSLLLIAAGAAAAGAEDGPRLFQKPTVNRTHVVFSFAGDLWSVGRRGGDARRLTDAPGIETDPIFSPDGRWLAFGCEFEGDIDLFVMPAEGGAPRRLTYHPDYDRAVGWTPDGKKVLLASPGSSHGRFWRLFAIPFEGGHPEELPLPMGTGGSFSPDGSRIAYVPIEPMFRTWKRYRGGATTPVWIADLADSRIAKVPRDNSNDFNPMWVGETVYFLSDRNGPFSLFSYDTRGGGVAQVLPNDGPDLKSASTGPDAIVYEQFGGIHLFDPRTGRSEKLDIRIADDLPEVRPRRAKAAKFINHASLSPEGALAAFEARGDIVTVPAEKGESRNLTQTPGVAERDPSWSPDGRWIAYFSDEGGEYRLHIADARGQEPVRKFDLGDPPTFYHSPRWSPDGKKIAYTDKRLQLWYLDVDSGTNTLVDANRYDVRTFDPAWSPDSRWLAYTKQMKSYLHAVFVYDLEGAKAHQLTDGMGDARYPVFDRDGQSLYFTASTDTGPTTFWEMSGLYRPVTRSVYLAVLGEDMPSPLTPQGDEEREKGQGTPASGAGSEDPPRVRIDTEDIDRRILALPMPPRNYVGLRAGKAGTLFVLEGPSMNPPPETATPGVTVHRFDLGRRKAEKLLDGAGAVHVSHDGETMLYGRGGAWHVVGTGAPVTRGQGKLPVDALEVLVDPRAEWRQMYHEVWRIERDYLYDPHFHGLDVAEAERKYAAFLPGIASRVDLNYLFNEMLGELSLGHVFAIRGDRPEPKAVKVGLLGCDYRVEDGRYRIARIHRGENWNPHLRSPLTLPGVNVKEGEYLLSVNGQDLRAGENVLRLFQNTAGKAVTLRVGPRPGGDGARDVTVVPLDNEVPLRRQSWVDANRRKVDRMSGGRVAYISMSDTWVNGYREFNRDFFAQIGKEGAILDDRFNGGGLNPDYVIDLLRRGLLNRCTTREGEDQSLPQGAIYGPKAMLINEMSVSGGDNLAWYFRKTGLGPLIGKRTWGGAVGYDDYPLLVDGGMVTAPRWAFYNLEGQWDIENHGVDPDLEVELDPHAVRAGHDPQLERAVQEVLDSLRKTPLPTAERPPYPDYHGKRGARKSGAIPE